MQQLQREEITAQEATVRGEPSLDRGVPVVPMPSLPAGTHYLVDGSRIRTVIRRDARIDVSTDAYFREDGVAVKVSARSTFAFPHPQSIVRLVRAAS